MINKGLRSPCFYVLKADFIFEILVLLIQPYPGTYLVLIPISETDWANKNAKITVTYKLSDLLLAFMFLRIIFFMNLLRHLSPWNTLYGRKILNEKGMHAHFILHFRFAL